MSDTAESHAMTDKSDSTNAPRRHRVARIYSRDARLSLNLLETFIESSIGCRTNRAA